MKVRDSGMPEELYWESLFDIPLILSKLEIARAHDVAELGCGYGSFTLPVAETIRGTHYAFDIDETMVERAKIRAKGRQNIVFEVRDVVEQGFGVTVDAVLLFNILHCEKPIELLRLAANAVTSGGRILVIHWRHGDTPRGPRLEIRPTPEQIIAWGKQAGHFRSCQMIDLPPWHYGVVLGM
ncbi:class I SAM-dependent methyltransferase [Lacunimicrobium album]